MSKIHTLISHRLAPWVALAAMFVASLPFRFRPATPDVSWLITMCERMLHGERAYIDIFETTPPVPTLLYMPGVLIEHWTGLGAEAATYIIGYLSVFAALALSFRILPKNDASINPWAIILPAAFFLLVVSNNAFVQREFFSAAFALPIVCVFVAYHQEKKWPSFNDRLFSVILAGLSVAIKPPIFILPGIVLAVYHLIVVREVRFLYSSGLIAAAVLSGMITIISLLAYPEFLRDVAPMMREIYVPVRHPLQPLKREAFMLVVMGLGLASYTAHATGALKQTAYFAVTGIGFLLVYVLQGKYFGYHVVPAALFMFAALCPPVVKFLNDQIEARKLSPLGFAVIPVIAWIAIRLFVLLDDHNPQMDNLDWAQQFDQPTAMSITPYIGVGFPLARQIDAQWVDRIHSQWSANYANILLDRPSTSQEQRVLAEKYYQFEIDRAQAVIREKKPDLLIQSVADRVTWLNEEMLARDPNYLDDYEIITEQNVFRIWARKDLISDDAKQ